MTIKKQKEKSLNPRNSWMYKIVHEPAACEALKDSCRIRHRRKAFSFCQWLLYTQQTPNQIREAGIVV